MHMRAILAQMNTYIVQNQHIPVPQLQIITSSILEDRRVIANIITFLRLKKGVMWLKL